MRGDLVPILIAQGIALVIGWILLAVGGVLLTKGGHFWGFFLCFAGLAVFFAPMVITLIDDDAHH
jgi:uncharacterized integral membrane protein